MNTLGNSGLITEPDVEALTHLIDVDFEENDDIKSGFKFTFVCLIRALELALVLGWDRQIALLEFASFFNLGFTSAEFAGSPALLSSTLCSMLMAVCVFVFVCLPDCFICCSFSSFSPPPSPSPSLLILLHSHQTFDGSNPVFTNKTLTKEYSFVDDEHVKVVGSKIVFKPGKV